MMYQAPVGFNIQFFPRNAIETYQMMASDIFASRLAVDDWSRKILFPEPSHATWLPQKELGQTPRLTWVDKELNYEQQVFP
jgi:hypothetical protein